MPKIVIQILAFCPRVLPLKPLICNSSISEYHVARKRPGQNTGGQSLTQIENILLFWT